MIKLRDSKLMTEAKRSTTDIVGKRFFEHVYSNVYSVTYLFAEPGENDVETAKSSIFLKIMDAAKKGNIDLNETKMGDDGVFIVKTQDYDLKVRVSEDTNVENETIWEVNIESDFFHLEEFRNLFLPIVKGFFKKRYCLQDQISNEICKVAYPLVNKLENSLREYLLRFFVKKVGTNWWNVNSNDALIKKIKSHGETRPYNGLLDIEIYSIDFVDLKELVTGNFSRPSNSDVVQSLIAILDCKDNPAKIDEKVSRLKDKFLGNWEKLFRDRIGIDNFELTWNRLYQIRNAVSHNSLITFKNFLELVNYYDTIVPSITRIIGNIAGVRLSETELESINELRQRLNQVLDLEIKLKRMDVQLILEQSSLFITKANLPVNLTLDTIDLNQLSIIAKIEQTVRQGEESEIPSIWVKFENIDVGVTKVLEYGVKTGAFPD